MIIFLMDFEAMVLFHGLLSDFHKIIVESW